MNDIHVTINGNVGGEPKFFDSKGKVPYISFRVGSSSWTQAGQTHTEWLTVKAYGALASNLAESIHKGTPVLVRGRLRTEEFETQDGTRKDLIVSADAVGIELGRGIGTFTKVDRSEVADD